MSEGLVDGLLDGEAVERDADVAFAGADSAAMAVAMDAARYDPELSRKAGEYLDKQGRLVDLQLHHFDEERRLAIEAAKRKRFADHLRNGLQALAALVATVIVAGLCGVVWSAAHDHGVVVEAFSVPPDLAQRGMTGEVVAKQVLDRLSDMQAKTNSSRAPGSYSNNWSNDLKVEIPETGVSLGQVSQYLRGWLGHQTHITGEVFHTASGVTVTARAGEAGATSFSGGDADTDKLIQQAAEAVYRQTQPYRYAKYLDQQKRWPEAMTVLNGLTQSPDALERAWADVGLGNMFMERFGDIPALGGEMRAALREVPGFAFALDNLAVSASVENHPEEAVSLFDKYLKAIKLRPGDIDANRREGNTSDLFAQTDDWRGDYADALRRDRSLLRSKVAEDRSNGATNLLQDFVGSHDLKAARAAAIGLNRSDPTRSQSLGMAALEDRNPAAITLLTEATAAENASGPAGPYTTLRQLTPWLAVAKARFGDAVGAQALIATSPLDCYDCVRARGTIAAARGDRREAERWFAEAIRQGPTIPLAFADRGEARLADGDVAGAITDARSSNALGPHFADALKLWGDGLMRQDRPGDAVAKYDKALIFAPAWVALQQARDAAARKS